MLTWGWRPQHETFTNTHECMHACVCSKLFASISSSMCFATYTNAVPSNMHACIHLTHTYMHAWTNVCVHAVTRQITVSKNHVLIEVSKHIMTHSGTCLERAQWHVRQRRLPVDIQARLGGIVRPIDQRQRLLNLCVKNATSIQCVVVSESLWVRMHIRMCLNSLSVTCDCATIRANKSQMHGVLNTWGKKAVVGECWIAAEYMVYNSMQVQVCKSSHST